MCVQEVEQRCNVNPFVLDKKKKGEKGLSMYANFRKLDMRLFSFPEDILADKIGVPI